MSGPFRSCESPAIDMTSPNFSADELLHFSRLITLGQLSACFAHEIKNPLMLIQGHIRLAEKNLAVDDPLQVSFEAIDRASRRIEEMAKWLLDFSRKRTPQTERFDIAELVSDAVHFTQPYFRYQHIHVHTQVQHGLPLVPIDRWQLIQAIVNVLQNAVDAMRRSDRHVLSITARLAENQIQIVISDTGTGIVAADLPFIFEPFFTTKGEEGTGLGLCITRQVVEQHQGTI